MYLFYLQRKNINHNRNSEYLNLKRKRKNLRKKNYVQKKTDSNFQLEINKHL